MTLTDRIIHIDEARRLRDNVIPFERREKRQTPRWLEWTRENEKRSVKDLTGFIGGGDEAA
jgi:hypothetical protein